MISINVIIYSNYMFCEVYRSHPEDSGAGRISGGYPADIRHPEYGFSGQELQSRDGKADDLNKNFPSPHSAVNYWSC